LNTWRQVLITEHSQARTSQVEHCLRLSNGALPSSEMWIYFIFFLIVRYVGKCCDFVTPKVKKVETFFCSTRSAVHSMKRPSVIFIIVFLQSIRRKQSY